MAFRVIFGFIFAAILDDVSADYSFYICLPINCWADLDFGLMRTNSLLEELGAKGPTGFAAGSDYVHFAEINYAKLCIQLLSDKRKCSRVVHVLGVTVRQA
ncbi:hypothetical protein RQN30_08720 [Arcanobacterium hippocoleae]